MPYLAGEASVIGINGTLIIELIAFILMVVVLARWAYPRISAAAEDRQRRISEALDQAEQQRKDAEARLKEAEARLEDARKQAQEVVAGANRSAEQIRAELKARGEEEAARELDRARRDIDAARQQAVESVRQEVADMVVSVTQKVVGDALDAKAHKKLIDEAIAEVRSAREADGNARGRRG
jgi:F-type H+-transporting ATPase subunit b